MINTGGIGIKPTGIGSEHVCIIPKHTCIKQMPVDIILKPFAS
jgi:hypothetical protein